MHDVYWMCGAIFLVLLTMRLRRPILAALKRFDDENVRRIARQEDEGRDANAHIRHALEVADEQVEPVQAIKVGAETHYLFEAQVFASRDEAEAMRARRVGVIARRFYEDLPAALMGAPERGRMSARERASARWKKTVH
jgi:hypothetical protein